MAKWLFFVVKYIIARRDSDLLSCDLNCIFIFQGFYPYLSLPRDFGTDLPRGGKYNQV